MSDGQMITIVFAALFLGVPAIVGVVLLLVKRNRALRMEAYTGRCQGEVVALAPHGRHSVTVARVRYEVGGRSYELEEALALRSEAIRVGPVPIGQRKTPKLGDMRPGREVEVAYLLEDPSQALIIGNDGLMNA